MQSDTLDSRAEVERAKASPDWLKKLQAAESLLGDIRADLAYELNLCHSIGLNALAKRLQAVCIDVRDAEELVNTGTAANLTERLTEVRLGTKAALDTAFAVAEALENGGGKKKGQLT